MLSDLPTVSEAGVPGYSAGTWYGVFLPVKTPPEIVNRLSLALKEVLASPALKATLAAQGTDVAWDTPEQFAAFVRGDSDKWAKLIREANLKVQ